MAIPWAGIGSVLSGVGSIASAFGGNDGDSLGKQLRYRWNDLAQAPKYQVQGAKAAGLHPLFAMGAGMGQSPAFSISGQGGQPFAESLRAAGQVAQDYGASKRQAVLDAAAVKESSARAYKAQAEGLLADTQSAQVMQQLNAAGDAKASQMQNSSRDKIFRSHVPVRDHFTGRIYYAPNPDIFELPETIGAVEYGRGQIKSISE